MKKTYSNRIWILFGKKINDEATVQDLLEFDKLSELEKTTHPEYTAFYKLLKKPINYSYIPDVDAGWAKMSSKINDQPQPSGYKTIKLLTQKRLAIAASILVIFSLGYLFLKIEKPGSNELHPLVNMVSTKPGSSTQIELPDGTKVWLNAASKLIYKKDFLQKREVSLVGEAFFDVAHQKNNPFVVHSSNINIKVLGTAFNVKAYPTDRQIVASLLRGSIELTNNDDLTRKFILRPNEKITIAKTITNIAQTSMAAPSEESLPTYSIVPLLKNKTIDSFEETAWLQEKMVFTSETFKSLAERMEIAYGVEISITDKNLAALKFTGVFDKLNINEAIQTLEFTSQIKFKHSINKNNVIITRK